MSESSAPDFDDVADELYSLPPEEFTAARNAYQKQAKQAGERVLAEQIRALAKPTGSAWLANQLAREHEDELRPLLELGAGLREATRTLAGDQLRQLSRQQHELVYALVQQARQLARGAGRNISDDAARGLEETLHAALADESAADLLMAGRLREALHNDGFGLLPEPGNRPRVTPKPATGAAEKDTERRKQLERDIEDAEQAVSAADTAREEARSRMSEAEQAKADASKQVEALREQLDEAAAAESQAEQEHRTQASALHGAERTLSEAQRHLEKVRSRLDQLTAS